MTALILNKKNDILFMTKKSVLMIGTSFGTMGGISTVVNAYREAGLFNLCNITYIATHSDGSKFKKLKLALFSYLSFILAMLSFKYDIIHVHVSSRASFWRKSVFITIGKLLFRKKIVFHLHGSEFKVFFDEELTGLKKTIALKIINMPDLIITLSESWKTWVENTVASPRVIFIHNSICPITTNKVVTKKRLQLLFLGRIGERKGAFDIIEALAKDNLKNCNFELLMGGDGDLESAKSLVNKYNLQEKIKFIGWVRGEQKLKLLQESAIFLLPSYNEGMPMSLLEALASGLPIIASTVGGIPQQVSDGSEGFLVEAGDIDLLNLRIHELLNNDDLQDRMAHACIEKFNSQFSTSVVLPQLEKVYLELRR
ncbi:glycosyltransferase family 4 protein [Paraglaciecola sp.]|uniref:glycosyltransferase family 4 protein n=1 Tax=Paraglaciecola sp. TaxID=1920173 RepID=UPI003267124E